MYCIRYLQLGIWHYLAIGTDYEPFFYPSINTAYVLENEAVARAMMSFIEKIPGYSGYNMEVLCLTTPPQK